MKNRLIEHLLSILFITILMLGALWFFGGRQAQIKERKQEKIRLLLDAPLTKINDPFERALLADCMDLFFPGRHDTNTVLISELLRLREDAFALARQLAQGPGLAQALVKDNLDDAATLPFDAALDHEAERLIRASLHSDHAEAVRAFVEKRAPLFGKK